MTRSEINESNCRNSKSARRERSILSENVRDSLDRAPTPGCGGDVQDLLDFAEITDRFHLTLVEAEDKLIFDCDDFEKPALF